MVISLLPLGSGLQRRALVEVTYEGTRAKRQFCWGAGPAA